MDPEHLLWKIIQVGNKVSKYEVKASPISLDSDDLPDIEPPKKQKLHSLLTPLLFCEENKPPPETGSIFQMPVERRGHISVTPPRAPLQWIIKDMKVPSNHSYLSDSKFPSHTSLAVSAHNPEHRYIPTQVTGDVATLERASVWQESNTTQETSSSPPPVKESLPYWNPFQDYLQSHPPHDNKP